ncbi:MAG TPA: NAD(P)/FAD-dependent oxidoreductase [Thermoanaerobaculia bacterium]|nr:NAD(P)/FAD-dependent oxidoreductase [Thermoanaerobaculia bacterium]
MKPTHITVIGAGLAGSLLGTALARRGHRVTLYEKRPDLRRVEISAGRSINLALANRGIHALEQVGVMDRVRPLLIPMAGRMLHHPGGERQFVSYGNKPHEVIYSVSRGGLNGILMDAAVAHGRTEILFEHSCVGVDLEARTIEVDTPQGRTSAGWEVLIGTDGSVSTVRDAILAESSGSLREEPLGHGYKELSIPPGPGGTFAMETNALHIWPRGELMLIALPNPGGSFTVTLFLPNQGEESFASISDPLALREFFQKRFADAVPLLPNLEEEYFGNPTGHLETIRCWPWMDREALILGDAAHAIVPFHGQGMNAAFEDCSELASCIDHSSGEWSDVFEELSRRRKPNAEAIADMALENYVEMRSTVLDPKFTLRKETGFRLEEEFPDRFIPRYSMVMFHLLAYSEAQRRGAIQKEILELVTADADSLDEVDFDLARRLVLERLDPFSA